MKATSIRTANEKRLLRIMHNRGVVTQTDLATETGLQPSTIFRIFRSLDDRGMIRPVERTVPEEPRQGRRPGYYELNPTSAYSLGIDVAGKGTAILLVDFQGRPVREHAVVFPAGASARQALSLLLDGVGKVLASERVDPGQLLGVGLGAPGVVDIARGLVVKYPRFPGMVGLPIRDEVAGALHVPVFVHNNASVVALAENRFGRAAGHESVVAYLLRTGVGGAFVQRGRPYTSQGMTAFELGHTMLVSTDGDPTHSRTLEETMSESALVERAHSENPQITDTESLVACMRTEGDSGCRALESVARDFVMHARNVALILNPEAFLIVARLGPIAEFFASRLDRELRAHESTERFNVGTVIPLEYDPILACRGAADLVFDSFFAG